MGQTLIFAVDFDGCLTEYNFPDIGEQTKKQKRGRTKKKRRAKKRADLGALLSI